jgi:hypothetical protein
MLICGFSLGKYYPIVYNNTVDESICNFEEIFKYTIKLKQGQIFHPANSPFGEGCNKSTP